MTDQLKSILGVIARFVTACGAALAGASFVWRAWQGDPANDPSRTVLHGLVGFVLILASLHIALRGFTEPDPARQFDGPETPENPSLDTSYEPRKVIPCPGGNPRPRRSFSSIG